MMVQRYAAYIPDVLWSRYEHIEYHDDEGWARVYFDDGSSWDVNTTVTSEMVDADREEARRRHIIEAAGMVWGPFRMRFTVERSPRGFTYGSGD